MNVCKLIMWISVIGFSICIGVMIGFHLGEKAGIGKANGVCKIICEERK